MKNKQIIFNVELTRPTKVKQGVPPTVFTNDTNTVEFIFNVTDLEVPETATAEVNIFMRDGSFFQKDALVEGSEIRYTLSDTEGKHAGMAQIQMTLSYENKRYSTSIFQFKIDSGLNDKVAVEVLIQDWDSITTEARQYLEQLADYGTEFSEIIADARAQVNANVVEGAVENKFNALEAEYAQDITSLKQSDISLTAQLQQTEQELSSQLAESIQQITSIETAIYDDVTNKDIEPIKIDMHYGLMHGVGWSQGASQWKSLYPIQDAEIGGTIIWCTEPNLHFVAGELIVIHGLDDKYYTHVIDGVSTTYITVKNPFRCRVTPQTLVSNFYYNYAHPRDVGYKAIADFALESVLDDYNKKLVQRVYAKDLTAVGSAYLSNATTPNTNYNLPNGLYSGRVITTTEIGTGAETKINIKEYGTYKFSVIINGGGKDKSKIVLTDINNNVIKEILINTNGSCDKIEITESLEQGVYKIRILSNVADVGVVGYLLEVYKCKDKLSLSDLDKGTHVFLGDSWFEGGDIINRLKSNLPNANLLNYGVGGNSIENLINRFTGVATISDKTGSAITEEIFNQRKDVTLLDKVDYVWVMCGTNDYLINRTTEQYKTNLNKLLGLIAQRGAKPIFFNASVGDKNNNNGSIGWDIFNRSREYADLFLTYEKSGILGDAIPTITPDYIGQTFIDTTNKVIYMSAGLTNLDWLQISN